MANKKAEEVKPHNVFLFHEDCREGQVFTSDKVEALMEDGWVDTPAQLKFVQGDTTEVTMEQAEKASPLDLKKLLESLGFIVMTQEQMEGQAKKMAAGFVDIKADELKIEDLPDDVIMDEVDRRDLLGKIETSTPEEIEAEKAAAAAAEDAPVIEGNAEEVVPAADAPKGDTVGELQNRFDENPEDLNKDELVTLGNASYTLGLRSNMKEATLIKKITEAMNGAE